MASCSINWTTHSCRAIRRPGCRDASTDRVAPQPTPARGHGRHLAVEVHAQIEPPGSRTPSTQHRVSETTPLSRCAVALDQSLKGCAPFCPLCHHGSAQGIRVARINVPTCRIPFVGVHHAGGGHLRSQATQHLLQRGKHVPLGEITAVVKLETKVGAFTGHPDMMSSRPRPTRTSGSERPITSTSERLNRRPAPRSSRSPDSRSANRTSTSPAIMRRATRAGQRADDLTAA